MKASKRRMRGRGENKWIWKQEIRIHGQGKGKKEKTRKRKNSIQANDRHEIIKKQIAYDMQLYKIFTETRKTLYKYIRKHNIVLRTPFKLEA